MAVVVSFDNVFETVEQLKNIWSMSLKGKKKQKRRGELYGRGYVRRRNLTQSKRKGQTHGMMRCARENQICRSGTEVCVYRCLAAKYLFMTKPLQDV